MSAGLLCCFFPLISFIRFVSFLLDFSFLGSAFPILNAPTTTTTAVAAADSLIFSVQMLLIAFCRSAPHSSVRILKSLLFFSGIHRETRNGIRIMCIV